MKSCLSAVVVSISLCALGACAAKGSRPLLSDLQSADYPVTYINDGAGDESVLNTLHYADGKNRKCYAMLTRMVDLKEEAIPLLIAIDYEGGRQDKFESGAIAWYARNT